MVSSIREILEDSDKIHEVTKIAFDAVDIDKSGQIDENELEKVLKTFFLFLFIIYII